LKKSILYKPSFDYKKKYESEGTIINTSISTNNNTLNTNTINNTDINNTEVDNTEVNNTETNTEDNDIGNLLNQIQNNINTSKTSFDLLPENLSKLLTPVFDNIELFIKTIPEDEYKTNTLNYPTKPKMIITKDYVVDNNSAIDEDSIIDIFSDTITRDIKDTYDNDINTILQSTFNKNLIDIFLNYSKDINEVTLKYMRTIYIYLNDLTEEEIKTSLSKYTKATKDIKSFDLKPLSDFIIKSQIEKGQKARLFNKIITPTAIIQYLRACKMSFELMSRYSKANFVEEYDLLDTYQNEIINNLKTEYTEKYEKNLLNLYKYLNTIVIFIDEYLSKNAKEIQAKTKLIKEGAI